MSEIRIPAPRTPASTTSASRSAAPKTTVLVVDENPVVLARLTTQLQGQGHDVLTATRPEGAISLVEEAAEHARVPSAAVLEVSLPDMTGFELATILRECPQAHDLPVVFVSDAFGERAHFTDDGVTAVYLNKSAMYDEVLEVVDELLAVGAAQLV